MTEQEVIKKKRGRKPKNYINPALVKANNIIENINTEEEKIIFHLPITLTEINNQDDNSLNIFIKSEIDINKKIETETDTNTSDYKITETINNNFFLNNKVNSINIHNLNFNNNTKCWWCRNCFCNPHVQLPEDYFNNTFYCIGHLCSYNCSIAYNIDLNDNITSKRASLLNLLYYKTYSKFINIKSAPHWITLEEYGGHLPIEEFRENSINNNKDYLILHPPMVSRQMQIEESYKQSKYKNNLSDSENKYMIKRNKPIMKQSNLELTMGLIKKIK